MKKSILVNLLAVFGLGLVLFGNSTSLVNNGVAASPLVVQTRVLQQGLNGYTGTTDTWVSAQTWDNPPQYTVNYGQNTVVEVSRGGRDNGLWRFDLTSVPTNSVIVSATLSLYNQTPGAGNCNQPGTLPRRFDLFRVLRAWDEGNQVSQPVTSTTGAHGATGDYAILDNGPATDIPWGGRGMAAGTDYADEVVSYANVLNTGWYSWNVTSLVRDWVRGDLPNYGLTLRDASGYSDINCEWRDFTSAQGTAAQRPKLTLLYNPDVPYANAGPDQENLAWNGAAINLNGSASHDRPGGNNATLRYAWWIVRPAFGSALTGTLPLTAAVGTFTPDVAGEWTLELRVTNEISETASDQVNIRLLKIAATHPRIFLTPNLLTELRARAVMTNPLWSQLVNQANSTNYDVNDWGNVMESSALVGVVSNAPSYCTKALSIAELQRASDVNLGNGASSLAGDIALVYDWCYPQMTTLTRTNFIAYFNAWGDKQKWGSPNMYVNGTPGWGNYWPRFSYSFALMGLAMQGDSARAVEWLNEYRQTRLGGYDLPVFDKIAQGGAWPEGTVYDWVANPNRFLALAAWDSATGEDVFQATPWFRERLGYLLLQNYPGLEDEFGFDFHPYLSQGDSERHRGRLQNYVRLIELALIHKFPTDPRAQQLWAYITAPPTANTSTGLYFYEFLWNSPNYVAAAPTRLTNYTPALGLLNLRSGWPTGAADTNPCATYITFNAGDHYAYHQHYDQNSFTIFKCGDLALDAGVYSGDGLSYHDQNYYFRTIAHNTLVVYNPLEDFTSARADAVSNDGGQRTVYPASRAPESVAYWDQYATQYDTADILRTEDAPYFTYALGDATKAYNNPTYAQSFATQFTNNTPKVTRFQREFVYLRPLSPTVVSSPDFVVLLDRVGVVSPSYSLSNTKLLFHVLYTPTVSGAGVAVSPGETLYANASDIVADADGGRLFIKLLAPAQRNVRVVGGRGVKSFWVNDANYDWHWDANEPQPRPVADWDPIPYGEWRLELEPADAGLNHNFLTVLYPTLSTTVAMPATTLVSAPGLMGAHIAAPTLNRLTLFSSALDGAAPTGTLIYSYMPTTQTLNVLFDLTPHARYTLSTTVTGPTQNITLTPDVAGAYQASAQGVLSFIVSPTGAVSTSERKYLPLIWR